MEKCIRCNEVDEDRRTLWMGCFYEMHELSVPFDNKSLKDADDNLYNFYTLRVCKDCRALWMNAIEFWYKNVERKESCASGIFIREFGANKEITLEDWKEREANNF